MLHADVSTSHPFTREVQLIPALLSQAYNRILHQKVTRTSLLVNLINMELIWPVRRSLIASWIGNLVGALFVGLPGVYFHLEDWKAGGLLNAEEARGEARRESLHKSQDK